MEYKYNTEYSVSSVVVPRMEEEISGADELKDFK